MLYQQVQLGLRPTVHFPDSDDSNICLLNKVLSPPKEASVKSKMRWASLCDDCSPVSNCIVDVKFVHKNLSKDRE